MPCVAMSSGAMKKVMASSGRQGPVEVDNMGGLEEHSEQPGPGRPNPTPSLRQGALSDAIMS